jgi:hypothetical protein
MKKLIAILALFICGCNSQPADPIPKVIGTYQDWDEIIIVHGCQYAKFRTTHGYNVYTHVGACTNCWAKMETLIGKKLNAEKE